MNLRERKVVLRSLAQTILKRDALTATRMHQLFQYKAHAVKRLQEVTKGQLTAMKQEAFEELALEVKEYQQNYEELELFLDV